jgi:3-oxoacyl-[acyl-carrier protein] reductase
MLTNGPRQFAPKIYAELMACSLTAEKQDGATMEIGGKKIALGVPGGRGSETGPKAYPLIPLNRGARPDEAAAAMLL